MDGVYQYSVFFEWHSSLLGEQAKRIETYFRVRRRSGGGDCGPVSRVKDDVYSVAFKYQKDQLAVLQKSEHVVAGVAFAVRGTMEHIISSPSQDPTAPLQSPQSIPASTPPPSGEEYELQVEDYLLRYLKECPKAGEKLEKEFDSMACSAQLYPEEERVSVRRLAPPGAAGDDRNWKTEVDKLFDGYLCHYEFDAHKVKALLQSCSSRQSTDEVKVYSEDGMAVVVGERSQVNARLMNVEDRSVVSEKQTSIRRLGEAKLRLLWKEIEHSLGRDCPGVKVTQGAAGQLVLEGSAEEILKAGDWISGQENLVLEKTVSDMSPHLLAFLRKAYRGPGLLGHFLGVSDKVEVELRDTELRLVSLSTDNLDETENALQAEIKEVKIDVPNCSAVPSELREKLKSKTDEMNQGQYRAQVVFGSDSSVCLLGHTKEVEELSEAVTQFILDQSSVQNKVHLPFSEIAQEFEPSVANNLESLSLSEVNTTCARYSLCDGFQVLVCQGDITKQDADALVNAANEDLDHGGGVAAALSKAGGPKVQSESTALVKYNGKIPTGEVVVTTGGNLKCKKLLHAVGPVGGKSGGSEGLLLEKTVQKALNLAEMMEFRSIAIPCISSGTFGVPVTVCSEAIVTAVKKFGSYGGRSLSRVILIDNRGEVVRAMQEACDRLLQGISTGNNTSTGAPRDLGFQMDASAQDTAGGATAGAPGGGVHVEIIQGTIETQQVDGLVCPIVGHDPLSTRVGNILSNIVGPQLTAKFYKEAGGATVPGGIVLVDGLPALQSKGVFFLNLLPWDNNQKGNAVQVLRQGIRKMLASCQIRDFSSVALPVLGTGEVLRFPHSVASRVVLEEVREFEQNRVTRTSFLVRVVIHPNDKESSKAFQSAQETLHLRGFTNDANPDQASFYRHVSITNDEVTAMLGGVKLQMVCGDIIQETTDAIINTTDFSNNQSGVSQAILTAAGSNVQAELARVGVPADLMCTTGPGLLGCKEIIHASFKCDPQIIRKKCKKILKQCESKGFSSAAFPAINTGGGGMDSDKACKAMLDGMTSAITDLKPNSLTLIRIVILQPPVFQAFRSELENRFGQTAARHLSLKEKAKQKLKKLQDKRSRASSTSAPQVKTFTSSKPPPAVISVIGCGADTIRIIKRDLEEILQKQLVEREVDVDGFSRLDAMELEAVQAKVKVFGISLEHKRRQSAEDVNGNRAGNLARERSGSGREVYMLKGLKEDVLSVIELVNKVIQKALCEDLQDREEAMLALDVQWSIQDINQAWHELSLHDNYMLEEAHRKKQVSVELMAPDGQLTVNLRTQEATNWLTGITYKVKRSETEISLDLPTQWEPMNREDFKKVELRPNSHEYQVVAKGFLKTAKYNILTIERVQNPFLWHAYSVCRQRIFAKNGQADLGEKSLYHGTSAESCSCIERNKFDRGYAGAHAAAYGKGVYFAVNADYSARNFSPADTSGRKRLYVARVLTGRYTVGNSSMKAPPPRGSDPTDHFDSLVDNQQQPTMFVIFHDDQAYPEYLITFR